MRVERLAPAGATGLLGFLDRKDQGFCYCRFWDFRGSNEAWLASVPERNRADCAAAIVRGELSGLLALDRERVIGWLRFAPTRSVAKLVERGLEPEGELPRARASILCLAVAAEERGRGVARSLLDGALEALTREGFAEVHAYPRPEEGLAAAEAWTGPLRLYGSRGFDVITRGERRWTVGRGLRPEA